MRKDLGTEQEERELSDIVPDTLAETERNMLLEENRVNRKTRRTGNGYLRNILKKNHCNLRAIDPFTKTLKKVMLLLEWDSDKCNEIIFYKKLLGFI